ncbi:hypothetical protein P154DRAFT_529874 [Amniculicola lignicola CBS 123094]|uniref:Chromo domain-containing protein n=1 Tax=Amniculicola lignicola CBS 123094 TaxID=1392246 RepID=A0A6A5X2Q7_9PLEO|nr:hypothetical protein P154DRAFT_529874 [Amniculicola lignicola CBS 123094]
MDQDESDNSVDVAQGENGDTYNVEAIISEGEPHQRGQKKYLVKWEGFPMDDCTWEPPEHFDSPLILEHWSDKKKTLTNKAFQDYILTNILRYHKAYQNTHGPGVFNQFQEIYDPVFVEFYQTGARKRRVEKFAQTRSPAHGASSGESSSDTPRVNQRRPTQTKPAEDVPAQRRRKLPFEDSSSESEGIVDSFMEERSNKPTRTDDHAARGKSNLFVDSPPLPREAQNASSAKNTIMKPIPPASRPGVAPASTGVSFSLKPKNPVRSLSTSTTIQPAANSITTAKPQPSTSMIPISRPGLGKAKRSGAPPIRIVNKPKPTVRREWQNSSKHFSTLHSRAEAQKRANREKTPDFTALQFVGGAPSGIVGDSRRGSTSSDPQAGGGFRGQDSYREYSIQARRQATDPLPHPRDLDLADWERAKIPLTCFEYRNGACQYPAQKCRFLHRQTSKVSPMDGTVPGKYRNYPVTCYNWMMGANGCSKTDDDCLFAHRNTGLLGEMGKPPREIDATAKPAFMSRRPSTETSGPAVKTPATGAPYFPDINNDTVPPKQNKHLTCFFWMEGGRGCNKGAGCAYAHKNTGWLAQLKEPPIRLDLALKPFSRESQSDISLRYSSDAGRRSEQLVSNPMRPSPLKEKTCFFWAQGICDKSEAHCKCAHRYTGQIADPPRGWKPRNEPRPAYRRRSPVFREPSLAPPIDADSDTMDMSSPEERRRSSNCIISPDAVAHFVVPQANAHEELSSAEMKCVIEEATQLNFQKIFAGNGTALLSRRAFLFFHPEQHAEELELITRWLLMHHVEVSNFWTDGSWGPFTNHVTRGGTGVILTHPDFEAFDQVKGFGQVLRGEVNIWSIGYQPGIEYDPDISVGPVPFRFDCIPIFPHGGVIYITDDVFRDKPREALKIMKLFISKIERCRQLDGPVDPWKRVDDGCLLWRLATPPELLDSIYLSIEKYADWIEAGDSIQISRLELYDLLSRIGYVEQDTPEIRFRPDDHFPIMSERRDFWPEYFEALKEDNNSSSKANDLAVQHYSEWLVYRRRDYRQLFVVHTEGNKAEWMKKHQSIDLIMTPEKCIKLLEQAGKGSRIDFLDWAFAEKEKKDLE